MAKSASIYLSFLLIFLVQLFPSAIPTGSSSTAGHGHNHHGQTHINRQKHVDEETDKRIQEFLKSENDPKKYVVSIGVKFSDGSEIWNVADMKIKEMKFLDHKVYLLEEVLKVTNGIEVEYIENPKMKAARKEAKKGNMNPFIEAQLEGGCVRFKTDINQAIVMGEKDGTYFKRVKENVKFQHEKGEVLKIWDLMKEIKAFDGRFYLPTERHHDYVDEEHLDVLFDGHTMATLSLPFIGPNGKEELREVIRYHFSSNGLNIFIKDGKYNYLVENPKTFHNADVLVDRNRGQYLKNEFRPRLWSKKLSLADFSRIAVAVINEQPWGGDFKCHNFVYEFVMAIVDEKDLQRLKQFDTWPESQCILNQQIIKQDDGRSGFAKSVLRNPVLKHLKGKQSAKMEEEMPEGNDEEKQLGKTFENIRLGEKEEKSNGNVAHETIDSENAEKKPHIRMEEKIEKNHSRKM